MSKEQTTKPDKATGIQAAGAGAGGGTIIVSLAKTLGPNNPLKEPLIILAPTLAIVLSGIWWWVARVLDSHSENRKREARKKELETELEVLEPKLVKAIEDAKTDLEKTYYERVLSDLRRTTLEQWIRLGYPEMQFPVIPAASSMSASSIAAGTANLQRQETT